MCENGSTQSTVQSLAQTWHYGIKNTESVWFKNTTQTAICRI